MNVLGLSITRTKAAPQGLQGVNSRGGWWPIIREAATGYWQRNIEVSMIDVLTSGPVWACVTLIAFDVAKMGLGLTKDTGDGIWEPTTNTAYSPVLRKPNRFQNRIVFIISWIISKLVWGNTYVLKQRDSVGNVRALYVLDPQRVKPLVAPDGSVFYEVAPDALAQVSEAVTIPAREIIHDIMVPLYHPLVGISPIHACGLSAMQGLKIRRNSALFFENGLTIAGVLVAPGNISEQTATRLEEHWNANYAGPENVGKIAALGDGLKFEPMQATARDSQLSEQLKDAAIEVCNAFHVPAYMAGYGPPPNYNNIEALNQQYYSQCLQILIESLELCLDEGLSLDGTTGVEFDLDGLIRMDSATKMTATTAGVRGGVYTPNEGRRLFNRKPLKGGDTVFLQEQDHSLEWLSRRDAMPIDPPAAPTPTPDPVPPVDDANAKGWSESTCVLVFTVRGKAIGLPVPEPVVMPQGEKKVA